MKIDRKSNENSNIKNLILVKQQDRNIFIQLNTKQYSPISDI